MSFITSPKSALLPGEALKLASRKKSFLPTSYNSLAGEEKSNKVQRKIMKQGQQNKSVVEEIVSNFKQSRAFEHRF
jgi:hypothetical protein